MPAVGILLDPKCRYTSTSGPSFSVDGVKGFYSGNQTPRGTELLVHVPSLNATDLPGSVKVLTVNNVMTNPCNAEWQSNTDQPTIPWTPTSSTMAPTEFFDRLANMTPLSIDGIQPVTIDGHDGLSATFDLAPGFLTDCGGGQGTVFVTDYGSTASGSAVMCGAHQGTCELWIADNEVTRLAAITVNDQLVLIAVNGPTTAIFNDIAAEADKLIAKMHFN